MKIVVLDGYGLNPGDLSWEWLDKYGEVTVYDRTSPDRIADRAKDADVLFTLTKRCFSHCPILNTSECLPPDITW